MKRFTFVAMALCLAFVMAVPAMAVDVSVSGSYTTRGYLDQDSTTLSTAATNAFMDMRLRLQPVFTVTDNLKVTARFDALDRVWGVATGDLPAAPSDDNIDWDRAYMTVTTGIGKFDIGRMPAGTFGTSFADSGTEADRIKFTTQFGALTLLLLYEKSLETDAGTAAADADTDQYIVAPIFKTENFTAGVLIDYVVDKDKSDSATLASRYDSNVLVIDPYITGKFGNFSFEAEVKIYDGDSKDYTDTGGPTDISRDEIGYFAEVGFNFGAFSIKGGYAFASGDQNGTTDNEDSDFGGFGNDWGRAGYILTGNTGTIDTGLGTGLAKGNLSKDGQAVLATGYGAKALYLNGSFTVSEQLTLGFVIAYAEADEVPATWKDEYGTEVDLTLKYKIMDNLTYSATAAYLSAGDYWYGATSGVEPTNFEDPTSFYHSLVVSF